jgi:hypothetical protein
MQQATVHRGSGWVSRENLQAVRKVSSKLIVMQIIPNEYEWVRIREPLVVPLTAGSDPLIRSYLIGILEKFLVQNNLLSLVQIVKGVRVV